MKIRIYMLFLALATAALVFLARAQTLDDHALNIQKTYYLAQIAAVTPPNLTYLGDNALNSLQVTYLAMISTNGTGGGSATNAVSTISSNGVSILTGATGLNFVPGANSTISITNSGATANVVIGSTGGGTGAPLNGTNMWTGTNNFTAPVILTNANNQLPYNLARTNQDNAWVGLQSFDNQTFQIQANGDLTTATWQITASTGLGAFGSVSPGGVLGSFSGPMGTTNGQGIFTPTYNAASLSNLPPSAIVSNGTFFANGTIATNSGKLGTGAFLTETGTNRAYSFDASTHTNLNASALASGTVPDAQLSANVPLLNASTQNFSGDMGVSGKFNAGSMNVTTLTATTAALNLASSTNLGLNGLNTNGATAGQVPTYQGGNNTVTWSNPPAGGSTVTFNSAQFDNSGGTTNIKSGAIVTNLIISGSATNAEYVDGNGLTLTNPVGFAQIGGGSMVLGGTAHPTTPGTLIVSNAISGLYVGETSRQSSSNVFEVVAGTNAYASLEVANTNSGLVGLPRVRIGGNNLLQLFGGAGGTTSELSIDKNGFSTFSGGLTANTVQASGGLYARGGQVELDSRIVNCGILYDAVFNVASLQIGVSNMTKVANYTLLALDVGTTVNNIGAGIAVTNTLLTATLRAQFGFYVGANSNMCIAAIPGTDVIYWNGWSGTNLVCGVSNSYAHMFSPGPGAWIVDSLSGPWKGLTNSAGVGMPSSAPAPTAISPFPGTTVNWTNTFGVPIQVYIDNTAITGTAIKKNGTQIFGGLSNDTVLTLYPSEYFSETYSVGTPTGTWSPMQ
jgi:hypothetical protein